MDTLQEYISSPADYSTLVFIGDYEKIDQRKKIAKLLKKAATVVECNQVKPYELDKWIKTIAQQMKIMIDSSAMQILEEELSTNLQLMESEMNKLALYAGEEGVITKEIAERLISHSVASTSLRMVDAVMDHDLYKAIAIVKDLEKTKEEPIAMIGLLAFQFRMIFRVKLLKEKGYGQSQIQKTIGAHPYVIKMAWNREKQFTLNKLHFIMDKLANADSDMKQGKMEKNIAFELLVHDLITAS
ncbi:DNA polymerase III subunit delta [Virgibacillus halophilus]|uniref:DNA polymerase III subunit delta n=1 Tax=Tigheibacillus halophilus TaxID=361280 RepID=A0ABU5CBM7_9BACI|nr:DNA polymerase III subunit delta [Virgibacillus halophilus]